MKRKIKILYLLVLLPLLIPLKTNALTGSIGINCNKTGMSVNAEAVCTITGTVGATEKVSALKLVISVNNNLEVVSFVTNSIWQGDHDYTNLNLYTDSNKSGTFNIGQLTVRAKSNATVGQNGIISITDVVFNDENFEKINIESVTQNLKILSSIDTLSSLTITEETIEFNADTLTYDLTIDKESITIEATATDSNATVEGTGIKTLKHGTNEFQIIVTSEGGTSKIYTLNINRPGGVKTEENPKTGSNYSSIIVVITTLGVGIYLFIKKPRKI